MGRHEDSVGPFGTSVGSACSGDIKCDWCGTLHNDGYPDGGGEPVSNFTFGDKQICECCWEKVEAAVLQWMPEILPWYDRILRQRVEALLNRQESLRAVSNGPAGDSTRLDALETLMRKAVGIGSEADKINLAVYRGGDLRDALNALLLQGKPPSP